MNGMISRRVGGLEYRDGHLGNQWDAQIYTSLPPREGVWPVGGRASGYTPSLVPPRGGATSCLPRQPHLLTCSEQCHLQVRAKATVRCGGLLRAQVAPVK